MRNKIGVLVSNLGTPDGPEAGPVRKYLGQFLMDPYVIDISAIARFLLVHGIILRFRPAKSAEAYQKIWTERGSPLLFHSQDLTTKLTHSLGTADYRVALGMRYGNPSIESAFNALVSDPEVGTVLFLPLYPQYSYAATLSSEVEFERVLKKSGWFQASKKAGILKPFYNDSGFIDAFAERVTETVKNFAPDHTLFSYHGVPERQIRRLDPTKSHCLVQGKCCETPSPVHSVCYRAQSVQTTSLLARKLNLKQDDYSLSFQSRLGRTPWIRPYTDELLDELPKKGIKRLAVVCPAFVADCLETLEEISMRAKEQFQEAGGEDLILIPSLNSEDSWAGVIQNWVRDPKLSQFKWLSPSA
jgi:ferrochelatase